MAFMKMGNEFHFYNDSISTFNKDLKILLKGNDF